VSCKIFRRAAIFPHLSAVLLLLLPMATKGGNARGVPVGALLVAALLLSSLVPTSASSYPASEQPRLGLSWFCSPFESRVSRPGVVSCVGFDGCFVAIAGVVSGFLSNAASAVVKRLWSLKSTTKTGLTTETSLPFCSTSGSDSCVFLRCVCSWCCSSERGKVYGEVRGRVHCGDGLRRQQAGDRALLRGGHPERRTTRHGLHEQQHLQDGAAAVPM
jgi:hypothetical protein